MKNFEQKNIDFIIGRNARELNEFSSVSGRAWKISIDHMTKYLQARDNDERGLDPEKVVWLAAARMQVLHDLTTPSLSGKFSESEIFTLMGFYSGDVISPERWVNMTVELNNYLGPDEPYSREMDRLFEKLEGLSALERLTLADAVEQVSYQRGAEMADRLSPKEFLPSIGIELI